MPGSERQNNMFEASPVKAYVQEGHPHSVTSCGRRRNDGSPIFKKSNEPRRTTKGKGRNFRTVKEGAGMTAKGVREYRRKNPGSKAAKRRKSFCARSKSWKSERGLAARRRWKC